MVSTKRRAGKWLKSQLSYITATSTATDYTKPYAECCHRNPKKDYGEVEEWTRHADLTWSREFRAQSVLG